MLSLNARLLVAASVVLIAFLGLTGWTLDRAFRESALIAVRDRLQAEVYMLLGAAELKNTKRLILPESLPEVRFSTPGSGLYAVIIDGYGRSVWQSPSMLGVELPAVTIIPEPGDGYFEEVTDSNTKPLFSLVFTVSWETELGKYRRYIFRVAETRAGFDAQVNSFRRNLWGWLLAAALVLLLVQGLILRWGLQPLRRVAWEVNEIEAGHRSELAGPYPRELRPLTRNLNAFIRDSHTRVERYRNALGDLAHSLKTPLAILHGAMESESSDAELRPVLREQVSRMDQTVDYQLQRAAALGRVAMAVPVSVAPLVRRITDSLAKVYADRSLQFDLRVDEQLVFCGDEGDLLEILGNLVDNACKWCRTRIRIYASADTETKTQFMLEVEDDGPGIPADKRRVILNRGERADTNTIGHGIGMAVVRDLVEEVYRGTLEIGTAELGGARVRVRLQF